MSTALNWLYLVIKNPFYAHVQVRMEQAIGCFRQTLCC
jgi:hypothetical protein